MASASGIASEYFPAWPSAVILALCAASPCAKAGRPEQAMVANATHNNANRLRIFMIMLVRQAAAVNMAPDCQYNCQYDCNGSQRRACAFNAKKLLLTCPSPPPAPRPQARPAPCEVRWAS